MIYDKLNLVWLNKLISGGFNKNKKILEKIFQTFLKTSDDLNQIFKSLMKLIKLFMHVGY